MQPTETGRIDEDAVGACERSGLAKGDNALADELDAARDELSLEPGEVRVWAHGHGLEADAGLHACGDLIRAQDPELTETIRVRRAQSHRVQQRRATREEWNVRRGPGSCTTGRPSSFLPRRRPWTEMPDTTIRAGTR